MELWREWCDLLIEYDIPGGPMATVDMALNNPQVLSQKMVIEMEHPYAPVYSYKHPIANTLEDEEHPGQPNPKLGAYCLVTEACCHR